MRVVVNPPHIDGETVVFSWEQSKPNPFQYDNAFYFRYEGVDLSQFTNALFHEMFLGLQLNIFANYGEPVDIVFPEPVSPYTVAYWQKYFDADHVSVSPLASSGTYSPWKKTPPPPAPRRSFGVLFGGGKDSTLAACLLSEIYGADQVVLFQFVLPFRKNPKETKRIEQRQRYLMLQPMREQIGVATQHGWTDFVAQLHKSRRQLRPHLELYMVGFLPAFLQWGISMVTTSFPWSAFPIRYLPEGEIWFRYRKSRPEMLATLSAHYRAAINTEITLTNVNLLFTPITAFRMLVERYPQRVSGIVMCVRAEIGQQWCYKCYKCAEYAFYGLACGVLDPAFDYDQVFTQSQFIHQVVEYVESGVERSTYGNVPWQPWFGNIGNYIVDCHSVAKVHIDQVKPYLSGEGLGNLLMFKAAFGNTLFPTSEKIPQPAIDLLGNETVRKIARIAAEHLEIVDRLDGPFHVGDINVEYDFTVHMTPETGHLAHIRP